ncbi:MAG: hypothetical protein ACLR56_01825 [Oscillospiraceae bacterium]
MDGRDRLFVAVVLPGEDVKENVIRDTIVSAHSGIKNMFPQSSWNVQKPKTARCKNRV